MHLEALVGTLGSRNDRGVADQRVMDTRIGDQISLELVEIDVKRTIESQRGCDGADDLGDQAVQVLIARAGNVQITTADVVDSLVVNQERTVGILDRAMG